jgi:adsorption protein B
METWSHFLRWLLIVAGSLFLISGLDDLFVDVYYYARRIYRRIFVYQRFPRLREEDLRRAPEKPIALLIPAWDEQAVIAKMLEHTLKWVDYRDYHIFVGTYPNDEGTLLAVAAVQERDPRVHRIVCPHDGPTNKADCLNWVVEGIHLYEKQAGRRFEVLVIHDAEDIVHPLSLKLFNHLVPRFDMVQLPVVPLEVPYRYFTAGTYLDEFAEFHTKDLLVRERVAGMIPSAGVGTAFSRKALDGLARSTRKQLFNVDTLTEDYDIGFRLHKLGRKSILVQMAVERTQVVQAGWFRRREKLKRVKHYVATREFFPSTLRAAVRQKSRWIYGIVFQGWKQLGWMQGRGMRYMIWRDRKALVANLLNLVGYFLLVAIVATWLYNLAAGWLAPAATHRAFPILVQKGTWLWWLVVACTVLMVHRMLQRALAVARVSDWKQALLSLPRLLWGNVLNFLAVSKAIGDFYRSAVTGETITWRKTAHAFPDEQQLRSFKRKLGDLLLENRLLSLACLTHAIEVQKQTGERLGDVLTRLGYVREEDLLPVLASQLQVEARRLDPQQVREPGFIPESAAREHLMVLVGTEGERLVIACADPASVKLKQWLGQNLRRPYRLALAARQNVLETIENLYGRARRPRLLLGELLLEAGIITPEQLSAALLEQKRTGRRLGEVLESLGLVSAQVVEQKLQEQQGALPVGTA